MLRVFCSRCDSFEKILRNTKAKEMALELKSACEKCGIALTANGVAYICSFECTYCVNCAEQMNAICPNCGGELVRRPRREERPCSSAAVDA